MSAAVAAETMAVAAATEAATNLNSMQQPVDGDSAWGISSTAVVLPASVKGLRRRRRGGFKLSVAALVPVIAAAAVTYLVLRCCLSLARANSSSGAHIRFLAGNKQETDKTKWDDCAGAAGEDSAPATETTAADAPSPEAPPAPSPAAPPAAATLVASAPEEKGGDARKHYLFQKALLNVYDLSALMETSRPVLEELPFHLRGRCIAAVLCLSIVELSSVLSLLDADERSEVQETIPQLSESIWALRHTIPAGELSPSRERHIICLHSFLDKLRSAVPPAAAADENERRQKLSELVVHQETALQQLDSSLHWLQKFFELYEKVEGKAAAASAVAGATTEQTAAETATAAKPRPDAGVHAIELTMHTRRNQALRDASFTAWMKDTQESVHSGLIAPEGMDESSRQPMAELQQQLLELQQTPLEQGKDPVLYIQPHEIQRPEKSAAASSGGRKGRGGSKESRSQGTVAAGDDVSAAAESAAANPDVASSTREASAASVASSAPSPPMAPETLPKGPVRSFSAVVSAASAAVAAQRPVSERYTPAGMKAATQVGMPYYSATAAMPSSLHRPHPIPHPPSSPLSPSSPWPQLSLHPSFDAAATAAAETSAAAPDSSTESPPLKRRRMQRRGTSSSDVEGTEGDARRGAEKGTEQTKEPQRGTKGSGLAPSDWVEENTDDQQE
ncbi:hypothetical protein EBH_0019870 [Eimeria brunetti]|uniref:Uncharacterized protein n=1 Tax=Eimeria brunetti TaxID=51314 RepID=U6LIA3_9EIME|nr:hypothetical protein EBH_0019870 [Eimeria brunetti]